MNMKHVRSKFVTVLLLALSLVALGLAAVGITMRGVPSRSLIQGGNGSIVDLYARFSAGAESESWVVCRRECLFAVLALMVFFASWRVWQHWESRKNV